MFSCEFCEISKNTVLQNTLGRLPLKGHKPEKILPCESSGIKPYGVSKYQVKVIQTTLNKNAREVLNADTFGDEAKQ